MPSSCLFISCRRRIPISVCYLVTFKPRIVLIEYFPNTFTFLLFPILVHAVVVPIIWCHHNKSNNFLVHWLLTLIISYFNPLCGHITGHKLIVISDVDKQRLRKRGCYSNMQHLEWFHCTCLTLHVPLQRMKNLHFCINVLNVLNQHQWS